MAFIRDISSIACEAKNDYATALSSSLPELKLSIQYRNPSGSGRRLNEALYSRNISYSIVIDPSGEGVKTIN